MTQLENERSAASGDYDLVFPDDAENLAQNEEWFELRSDGNSERLRFHDYDKIYSRPGLYERLFYEELECDSPRTVCNLLVEALEKEDRDPTDLRVLDVGAGNGMVAEELREIGASYAIGVDIIEEAAIAAKRDRPKVYDEYLVADLTALTGEQQALLESSNLNCLASVAALGFDDIPPLAFANSYNVIETGGLVSFCLKEDMVSGTDSSGFSRMIDEALVEGAIELRAEQRYRHRLSASGKPLYYVAMVGEKKADLPAITT